jgi:hypothetical protein
VCEQGTSDGDTLLLPAAQGGAALADHGVVAIGKTRDEVVGRGSPGCGDHFVQAGFRLAESDAS